MGYWDYFYYTPAKPKEVKDGIKLDSKKIGSTWWSKKWIDLLESFGWSNRLQRGRNYARRGQVVQFKIDKGIVIAKVQGTASAPYNIKIEIKPISESNWSKVFSKLTEQSIFIAKLLAGEIPTEIEEVFAIAGISLFPKRNEIKTYCSCPDSANPCKHIAAVHYILGEEFDRNPFMIFHLRGKTKNNIISSLEKMPLKETNKKDSIDTVSLKKEITREEKKVLALEHYIDDFWSPEKRFDTVKINITEPVVQIALLKRLSTPNFWQQKPDFLSEMSKIYKKIREEILRKANQ